ncbi:hypothetical protein LEP1GSC008_1399 [Leptospira kirschneri serovar Bulgarica str. Nikolaevo]|uniref:Uncharacterized protein n=1 Tax=Leptospira kirschneri serovar Bulgarica str. Nikolaevo TaxID=1240687 RepID=M6FPY7_9LEPT|nr:hypothetical protein LEP1GSC008_1399 [Leptospira kirschneri serovar Bulgarica str. Nikolaevo]
MQRSLWIALKTKAKRFPETQRLASTVARQGCVQELSKTLSYGSRFGSGLFEGEKIAR